MQVRIKLAVVSLLATVLLLSMTSSALATTVLDDTFTTVSTSGTWSRLSDVSAFGGSFLKASTKGATTTFGFDSTNGIVVTYIAKTGPAQGIAQVAIDGVPVQAVNLYSAAQAFRVPVFSATVTPGLHVMTVTCTGTKDVKATNSAINVDAFGIEALTTSPADPGDSLGGNTSGGGADGGGSGGTTPAPAPGGTRSGG